MLSPYLNFTAFVKSNSEIEFAFRPSAFLSPVLSGVEAFRLLFYFRKRHQRLTIGY